MPVAARIKASDYRETLGRGRARVAPKQVAEAVKERPIHISILEFLRIALPYGAARTLHHSPNEEADEVARIRAAELGAKPGWPDIEWHGRYENLSPYSAKLEVKRARGKLSDDQIECRDALMDAGVLVGVARSIDDARAFLVKHQIPTRDMLAIDAGAPSCNTMTVGGGR